MTQMRLKGYFTAKPLPFSGARHPGYISINENGELIHNGIDTRRALMRLEMEHPTE